MVKTTIKYVRTLQYRTAASYFIKHLPDLIQVLILIALILTFAEYRKANRLTQKSLEVAQKSVGLSDKTFKLSHIPWISSGEMTIDDPKDGKLFVRISFKNSSETPALGVIWSLAITDNRFADQLSAEPIMFSSEKATWMPNCEYFIMCHFQNTDLDALKEAIEKGEVILTSTISYEDMFGGKIRYTQKWMKKGGSFVNPDTTVDYPDYISE